MSLIQPSQYWRQVSPRGAIADFITVFREAGPNRWRFAVLAAMPTLGIFTVMANEEVRGPQPRPEVDFIRVWAPHRSDAEIIASNKANQANKDRLAAEQAQRDEAARQMYKALGRASGMDVDAIEKEAIEKKAMERNARQSSTPPPPASD